MVKKKKKGNCYRFGGGKNNLMKKITSNEITIKKLRTYKGFENTTEKEAEEGLKFIKAIALVLAEIYKQKNK
ncbi:MAG: hypothetical protein POELPBGB_03436 [Bacteroidia bacterium]|nr:hypothetical protein [Bacteroidia bacterium]